MPDGPWHAAVPVLAAAAGVTTRLRLGTLVATPNFRHPVTLARDAIALDDLSDGRLDLGLGPGSEGPDASALGPGPWTPAERMVRFEEFLEVLRPIVDGNAATRTTVHTAHYDAVEAPSTPGTVQDPLPLTIAAGGRKGLRLAALYGQQWVTIGPGRGPRRPETSWRRHAPNSASSRTGAARSGGPRRRRSSCGPRPRPCSTRPISSRSWPAPYAELGFDEFVLHHPDQTGPYRGTSAPSRRSPPATRPEAALTGRISRGPSGRRSHERLELREPWSGRPVPR